jgi:hypothetical protein
MSTQGPAGAIGDYVIERELGRGAFGVVYRAHPRGRPTTSVALKVVQGRADTDRLLLEPAMLSRLDHPCIVRLEDYFLRGGDLVLALELIDGRDLNTLLDEGQTFSPDDVREMLLQIGSALAAAHASNIIHRDLKPANILVTRRDDGGPRFVLTDFGIGQVREGIQTERHTGGTYLFMAPEQLRGRPGPQSDLWALGVVAYCLLTGRLPFPGPTLAELTRQVLYGSPRPPSEVCTSPIDADLERAILHLLERSLQERTASAEDLLRELGHHGPPDSVLERPRRATRPSAGGHSLDRRLDSGITWRKALLVGCVIVYLLPAGLISGVLQLAGMALFFVAQREGKWGRPGPLLLTLLSYLVLSGYLLLRYVFPTKDLSITTAAQMPGRTWQGVAAWTQAVVPPGLLLLLLIVAGILAVVLYIVYLFLPVIAGALFATLRRLRRERLLRDLAREGDTGSERYLEALRQALDSRFEDVGLHLRYAEALFARGRIKEAAVEARILLRQDPFNFNGNLLLANAYFALGLLDECVDLCDRYLGVSGYCFEFSELRQQCQWRQAA